MHDPLTVAFEIKYPWREPRLAGIHRYRNAIVTVWHHDPGHGGSDDSCDWFNRQHRRFRIHPRLHIWHWRIQIHPVQSFQRWAWSRCERCHGRFRWGESPVSSQWDGDGPRWFRGEEGIRHMRCD